MRFQCITFVLFVFLSKCFAYKPVFLIPGLNAKNDSMRVVIRLINQFHPGTEILTSNFFLKFDSTKPLLYQVSTVGKELLKFSEKHPQGIHLIGYSQGGLVARGIIEQFPNHGVHKLISLSAPQAGQYGTGLLRKYFPGIDVPKEIVYKVLYKSLAQNLLSVANYWKDPYHQEEYYDYVKYLTKLNNEVQHGGSENFKKGFINLKQVVLFGGPDDEVIEPWQTSQFAFYYNNSAEIQPLKEQRYYTEDLFGLRTLDERGDLKLVTAPGLKHREWTKNETFIESELIPLLD
uniref:palmitoyl-CoA hydrolase n=1 Tax=Maconellicoccus hirsutus TaxID=177089 RepID=A2I492_MACHI|nr:putative palmitoyl-protein thioesterase [Maconellicoccus hirsutus]